MLTINNIQKLEGNILPNGFIVEKITIAEALYVFQLGKQNTLWNPMTFQPNIRFYNKSFTLNRYLDELNPFYMLTDEMGHYTWVNSDSFGSLDKFRQKLNELINIWN
jgi:hypothetical protein